MSYSLCGQSVANVGEQDCDKAKGILQHLLIFNGNFSSSDYADPATLFAKMVTNSKLTKTDANKVFPLSESQDVANASAANKEGSLGLGLTQVLQEGKPKYTIKLLAGSDLLKRLRTFNNQTIRVLEYDTNGTLWGTKSGTNFIGYKANLFFTGGDVATGQNLEEKVVTVTVSILSTSEYKDNSFWVSSTGTNFNFGDVKALLEAPLLKVSNTSNVYKYSLKIQGSNLIGGYDILPAIGTALVALVANFAAKYGPGVPTVSLPITSMAYNVGSDGLLSVTYDSTVYGTVPSGNNITLIPPTVLQLDTGSVFDLEILPVTHVK